jgi:DNA-directed RNA polymerase specialized sigma24 family protein
MNLTVTRLDYLLYAWLAAADDRLFARAFEHYYAQASQDLIRYLARRSPLADLDVEQIAVDALLKFFARVGRDRRAASATIARLVPRIEPLDLGIFHIRQVRRWAEDVGAFRESSAGFVIDSPDLDTGRDWRAEIDALTAGIPPLQRQGCHLLQTIRSRLLNDAGSAPPPAAPEPVGVDATTRQFAEELLLAVKRADAAAAAAAAAAERHLPGVLQFVEGAWTITDTLPLLRVPTNGYLFDIAQSLYLDECKARSRQKRGGLGDVPTGSGEATAPEAQPLDGMAHPLERLDLDSDIRPSFEAAGGEPAMDTAAEHMGEEFCEKFFAFLCRPLVAAEDSYAQAAKTGSGRAERKRLESIGRKMERVTAVLTMRIEGETQEAIAEALGISRNQVKYIVEQIQEAHAEFTAAYVRNSPKHDLRAAAHR